MKEVGDVVAMFCGHDHVNDFYGHYYGISLYYGRKTGYGGYGPAPLQRGARVIEIKETPFQYRSWIRQEDLTVMDSQPIHYPNETEQAHLCCRAKVPSNIYYYYYYYDHAGTIG